MHLSLALKKSKRELPWKPEAESEKKQKRKIIMLKRPVANRSKHSCLS